VLVVVAFGCSNLCCARGDDAQTSTSRAATQEAVENTKNAAARHAGVHPLVEGDKEMEQNRIPKPLISAFQRSDVVLFVGSGMSNCAGLPMWSTLIERLESRLLAMHKDEETFYRKLDQLQKVQYMYDRCGKQTVIEAALELLRLSKRESKVHNVLVRLPFKSIVTTNWDSLLEDYLRRHTAYQVSCVWQDDQMSSAARRQSVIKIHGTSGDPKSVVFSEKDFFESLEKKPLLHQYVGMLVATSTILFLGYSLSEFDFKLIFDQVKNRLGALKKESFIFLPNGSDPMVGFLERRGLQPIVYTATRKATATRKFLEELSESVTMSANDDRTRLRILVRENRAFLPFAQGATHRIQANLGPLATPLTRSLPKLFGSEELTDLEIEGANAWYEVLKKGAKAKLIISLNRHGLPEKYTRAEMELRLRTLKANILKYKKHIEVVDAGIPTTVNVNIFRDETLIESTKVGHLVKGYTQTTVCRDRDRIELATQSFEARFGAIRKVNKAEADSLGVSIPALLIKRIDEILESGD